MSIQSRFSSIESGAPIEVLEMCRSFQLDPDSEKRINLSVGGFEADEGRGGHDFKVVKQVEIELAQVKTFKIVINEFITK
jgi:aspartate/tyrosine/aromatic aminotransferase